jgi:hypothetical protein
MHLVPFPHKKGKMDIPGVADKILVGINANRTSVGRSRKRPRTRQMILMDISWNWQNKLYKFKV